MKKVSHRAPEVELVGRIADGDEGALTALYDRYCRLLFGLVAAIVDDRRDAEEVLQEVFLQAWEQARSFDAERCSVARWLVVLARSRAIDRRRGRFYRLRSEVEAELDARLDSLSSSQPSPLDAAVLEERGALVRKLLEQMPETQRDVMRLSYFKGYSHREIADELELPLGTVKSRLRLGLDALRELLVAELPAGELGT